MNRAFASCAPWMPTSTSTSCRPQRSLRMSLSCRVRQRRGRPASCPASWQAAMRLSRFRSLRFLLRCVKATTRGPLERRLALPVAAAPGQPAETTVERKDSQALPPSAATCRCHGPTSKPEQPITSLKQSGLEGQGRDSLEKDSTRAPSPSASRQKDGRSSLCGRAMARGMLRTAGCSAVHCTQVCMKFWPIVSPKLKGHVGKTTTGVTFSSGAVASGSASNLRASGRTLSGVAVDCTPSKPSK
mmetsp:Transcript_97946/g.310636  ORF Transcript_97946/g.310636 Transcript_97946/m.310636 type:complete len:244 (+) Transcript_97946:621-1352(+)